MTVSSLTLTDRRATLAFRLSGHLRWAALALLLGLLVSGTVSPVQAQAVEEVTGEATETEAETDVEAGETAMAEAGDDAADERPPSESFDGSVTPEYKLDNPLKVYYETKRMRNGQGKNAWWWGVSEGTYWFLEPINSREPLKPPTGEWEVFEESQLKGVMGDGKRFRWAAGETPWEGFKRATVEEPGFVREFKTTNVLGEMKAEEARERERKLAESMRATPDAAPAAQPVVQPAAAPTAAPPVAAPPAAAPAEPVAEEPALVEQVKGLPDMWKYIIGIGAVLIILFFVFR